jgi:hypothetical protein
MLIFLAPSLARPGTSAGADGGRLKVYDAIRSSVIHSRTFRARQGKGPTSRHLWLGDQQINGDSNGEGSLTYSGEDYSNFHCQLFSCLASLVSQLINGKLNRDSQRMPTLVTEKTRAVI